MGSDFFEFVELKLSVGDDVCFKKRYRISNFKDEQAFFDIIENKVGWKCNRKKPVGKGDNWWQ